MRHSLVFADFLNRLRLIGVEVQRCPGYDPKFVWLFGMKGASFPHTKGPVYTVKNRPDDEPVTMKFIVATLGHLGLTQQQQAEFWNAQNHIPPPEQGRFRSSA